ncbi:MAG: type III secretion system stator protein SctL [Herminiimonas sp.]|nr:type III secretion system stator protein SctL [Herminiimonas sp.]
MVVWLRQDKNGIAVPDGIIRRDAWLHVGALDESFRSIEAQRLAILDEARQQAERILEAACEQASQVTQDAEESALRLYDEAYESARQCAIDDWADALLKSSVETHKQLRQQRERMARIVLAAVEKIVPLQDSQGTYRQVLRTLSKSMQDVRYVTVRVCPNELAYAETALRELAKNSALGKLIEVAADERLSEGACLVESDQGVIDLSLNSQIKALRAAVALSIDQGDKAGKLRGAPA